MAKKQKSPMVRLTPEQIKQKQEFIRQYIDSPNASSASLMDANANVSKKTLATMGAELQKDYCIQLNRATVRDYITKHFGTELADEYIHLIESHVLYKNDESSHTPGTPYCCAINMYPFLESGMIKMGGESGAPKHLESFCGSFNNLIFAISSEFNGAVAAVEFPLYFHYFARKDYGENYLETHADMIKAKLQHVVYTLNQPAAARGYQSVFFNLSFFDRYFFESMFGNFCFPDEYSTHIEYDDFNKFQKFFMEWLLEERKKSLLTFPVITEASLNEDGKPKDQEWAEFCADIRSRGLSFFSFNDDTVSALSSCCFTGGIEITYYTFHEQLYQEHSSTIKEFVEKYLEGFGEKKISDTIFVNAFNPQTGKLEKKHITGVLKKRIVDKLYSITVGENTVLVTKEHPFTVKNINTGALELVESEKLVNNSLSYLVPVTVPNEDNGIPDVVFKEITETHIIPTAEYIVYDIEVADNEHFVANNIVSHNCRLRSELDKETDFSYSLGAGGVSTGSTSVMTLNVNRFVQNVIRDNGAQEKPLEEKNRLIFDALETIVKKIQKFQVAHRRIVEDYVKADLISSYSAGFITLDNQFCTIGINGINEAAEFLGYEVSNNQEYLEWVAKFLGKIGDLNRKAKKIYGIKFNTELIPGENLGVKNAKWDKLDGYVTNRDCYNSYIYLPESDTTSIPDKFQMHGGIIADNLDGEIL